MTTHGLTGVSKRALLILTGLNVILGRSPFNALARVHLVGLSGRGRPLYNVSLAHTSTYGLSNVPDPSYTSGSRLMPTQREAIPDMISDRTT